MYVPKAPPMVLINTRVYFSIHLNFVYSGLDINCASLNVFK